PKPSTSRPGPGLAGWVDNEYKRYSLLESVYFYSEWYVRALPGILFAARRTLLDRHRRMHRSLQRRPGSGYFMVNGIDVTRVLFAASLIRFLFRREIRREPGNKMAALAFIRHELAISLRQALPADKLIIAAIDALHRFVVGFEKKHRHSRLLVELSNKINALRLLI
ncbi:MAG: hypothetical protein LIP23_03915, partial [Planctomycetes bacterium]|nr:hypothetical protein [Planctomycetota bacterium]